MTQVTHTPVAPYSLISAARTGEALHNTQRADTLSTDNSFAARVARVALLRGVSIKQYSLDFVAKQIRGPREDDMSDQEIFDGLKETAKARPDQFGLAPAKPTGNPRERAIADLDRENAFAELTRREKAPSPKVKLTDQEKAFIAKHPDQALSLANLKARLREANGDE